MSMIGRVFIVRSVMNNKTKVMTKTYHFTTLNLNEKLKKQIKEIDLSFRPVFCNTNDIKINELLGKLKQTKDLDQQNSIMTRIIDCYKNR